MNDVSQPQLVGKYKDISAQSMKSSFQRYIFSTQKLEMSLPNIYKLMVIISNTYF